MKPLLCCLFFALGAAGCQRARLAAVHDTHTPAEREALQRLTIDPRMRVVRTRREDDGALMVITDQGGVQVRYRLVATGDKDVAIEYLEPGIALPRSMIRPAADRPFDPRP
ncbi:MAG: hypothetical protein ACOCYP_10725 [Planctomycetota bacterium]